MYRYNPPPNWPAPPADFHPGPKWQPDPAWGPPPPGWRMWVDDGKLLDRPLVRDWIFWLWLGVSFVFVINGISQDYAGSSVNGFTAGAALVDVVVRLGFTALLFLLIPALIRRAVRRSRSLR